MTDEDYELRVIYLLRELERILSRREDLWVLQPITSIAVVASAVIGLIVAVLVGG